MEPKSGVRLKGVFNVKCFDPSGELKWEVEESNLVTNEGLQHILDNLFNGDDSANTPVDPWYVGLIDGADSSAGEVAAGDTLASHSGWSENDQYTGDRKEYVGVRSSQQMSNSGSVASFSINADSQVIGGAFLASVASGTSGTLLCGVYFSSEKNADNGDTLEVTYTFSAADDGA